MIFLQNIEDIPIKDTFFLINIFYNEIVINVHLITFDITIYIYYEQ